jgi:hypothetical protein
VSALLRQARRIRLGDAVAAAAAATVQRACGSHERHVDRLDLPCPCTWVEYAHLARGGGQQGQDAIDARLPQTVGCLVACDPSDPAHVAVFAAWRTSLGGVRHSFALMHWNRRDFAAVAAAAADEAGAADRLLSTAVTGVPPGFLAEIEIMQGMAAANDPRRGLELLQAQRDVSGEHLFLLAVLLMLGTEAVSLEPAPCCPPALPDTEGEGMAPANSNRGPAALREPAWQDAGNDRWTARIGRPARRWPWMRGGFRTSALSGNLLWAPPA